MIMSERTPCRAPRWGLLAIGLLGLATIPCWSLGQTPEIQRETELRLQLERLRAELEKTRAELKNAQADAANFRDLKVLEEKRVTEARDTAKAGYQRLIELEKARADKAAYQAEVEKAHAEWKKAEVGKPDFLAAQLARATQKRSWGPEQATGAPDTPEAGDFQTAWASRTEDDQDEWLQLEYAQPVTPVAVVVFENYNPGAVSRITVSGGTNTPSISWEVKDPTPVGSSKGVSIFAVPSTVQFKVKTVRLEIASRRVPGWNEIDAVGMLDAGGHIHWAASATASSFYGDQAAEGGSTPSMRPPSVDWAGQPRGSGVARNRRDLVDIPASKTEQRIDRLEQDMAEMKAMLQEMRGLMRKEQGVKGGPARP